MTALDMVVCDLTPLFYCTEEMPRGKGFKKSLDLHYKNIGEGGENRRLKSKLHQVSLSHPLSVSHTHTQMKLGQSYSQYNTHMYGAAYGPVKGQQLGDRGEGRGGVWPRVQVLSTFADRLAPVAMSHGRLSMLPASWPKGSYILSWC